MVLGGTIACSGRLVVCATTVGEDTPRTWWEGDGCTTVAAVAITGLLRLGLRTVLLTGDNAATA
jgi:cation transport ATPase